MLKRWREWNIVSVLHGAQSDGALGLLPLPEQYLSNRVDSSTIDLISSNESNSAIASTAIRRKRGLYEYDYHSTSRLLPSCICTADNEPFRSFINPATLCRRFSTDSYRQ
jgi:hypothetical protein